jgi:hypothetical protein
VPKPRAAGSSSLVAAANTMIEERRLERHIGTIAQWIAGSEHMVAFTGAGISTDSGIPDFRGPGGCGHGAMPACRHQGGGFRRVR